jgi:putative peptidoglycan lipid II flippase
LGLRNPTTLDVFWRAFRKHGGWAVAAAVTTEVMSNAPGYAITLIRSADAFAPIAVAALLFRPLGVVLTGLVQFERPRMARQIADNAVRDLERQVLFIRVLVALAWAGNALVVALIMVWLPQYVIRDGYDSQSVELAICIVGAIVLLKSIREPGAAALQAGAEFKDLARAGFFAAPVSLIACVTLVLILKGSPVIALAGALAGELVALCGVKLRYDRFTRELRMALA